ncbi:MAG TPA: ABC transporter permease, partial [Candidatus Limnocylindrales bacterium]
MGGRGSVLTGDDRALLEPAADARTRWIGEQVIAGITALSAFAAVFLVASTFSFSVLQRRRELGLLHAIGATPKQLRRMMLGEAVLVGAAASACGVLLGALAAPLLGSLLVDAGFEPPSFEIRYGALPLAAAFTVGLLVALAGVWAASRRGAK